MKTKISIIGAGPGGYAAAVRAAQLGAEVTLIEKERPGGTCLHWGCIPSKVMRTAAEILEKVSHGPEFGITINGDALPDMPAVMRRKERVIEGQEQGLLRLFKHYGIRYRNGRARIKAQGLLEVLPSGGDAEEVAWDRMILATGSLPAPLKGFAFDGKSILSSDHALSLEYLPASILIVGGGVIGCEFASIFSDLGASVTVVEALERLLPMPGVDEDCSKTLQREMKKRKIRFFLNSGVRDIQKDGAKCLVTLGPGPFQNTGDPEKQGTPEQVMADCVLVCVGRRPNSKGLGLESLGIEPQPGGWLSADHRMETSVPGIYAIGDMLGPSRIMLAHVAAAEGRIAAENAMGGNKEMKYNAVPGAIFTSPEIGVAGMTEHEARQAGHQTLVETALFRTVGKAHVIGEIAGQGKIVFEEGTGRILGAHIIGPNASDLIAEAALSICAGCTVEDMAQTIHAHPTLSEILQEVACKAAGRPFHA